MDSELFMICEPKFLTLEKLQSVIDRDFYTKNNYGITPLHWLCAQNRSEFDELIKYIIFPFKLKKNNGFNLQYLPKWAKFRDEQKSINAENFKYLEESAKKSAEILLLSLIRYKIKVPKYIKWIIVTFMMISNFKI